MSDDRVLTLTKALLDAANQECSELRALLRGANEHVCSLTCRSLFPAGHVHSEADHSDLCRAIRTALDDDGERPRSAYARGCADGARAERERCARIAEELEVQFVSYYDEESGYWRTKGPSLRALIAAAIRAPLEGE